MISSTDAVLEYDALEHALKPWLEGRDHYNDKDRTLIHGWWEAIQRFGGSLTDTQETYNLVALAQEYRVVGKGTPLHLPLHFPQVLLTLAKAAYDVQQVVGNHFEDFDDFKHFEDKVQKGKYGTFKSSNMRETFLKWLYAIKCVEKDVDDAVDTYLHHQNAVCKQRLEEMVRKTEECRRALAASDQAIQKKRKRVARDDDHDDGFENKTQAL
jgi:hypothetical protein